MISTRKKAVIAALLLSGTSIVSAQNTPSQNPIPITLGRLGVPHGYVMMAWTPTKTTMTDVCNGTATRAIVQSVHTNRPSNPLCGFPFEVDGIKNLEFVCDGSQTSQEIPVAISTDGQKTHNCTYLPLTIYGTYCGGGASLVQSYACQ